MIEIVRDLGRPRADLWEVAVWEDTLAVSGRELPHLSGSQRGHRDPRERGRDPRGDGMEPDGAKSIALTEDTLGIRTELP